MSLNIHERYQTFCRFCNKIFERDTVEEALSTAHEHEVEKHPHKISPPIPVMNDFFPRQYAHFDPVSEKSERCPVCKQLSMTPFQQSSTARQCANPDCRFVEERINERDVTL